MDVWSSAVPLGDDGGAKPASHSSRDHPSDTSGLIGGWGRLGDNDPDRLADVRDTIWTLNSPLLYGLLVTQRGWSAERYGAWVSRALLALAR